MRHPTRAGLGQLLLSTIRIRIVASPGPLEYAEHVPRSSEVTKSSGLRSDDNSAHGMLWDNVLN